MNKQIIATIDSLVTKAYKKYWNQKVDYISNWIDYSYRNTKIFLKHDSYSFWWDLYKKNSSSQWEWICSFNSKWWKVLINEMRK